MGTPKALAQPGPTCSRSGDLRSAVGSPRDPDHDAPRRTAPGTGSGSLELHRCAPRAPARDSTCSAHLDRVAPPFCERLLTELAAERLPARRPRRNPRAVKRKMSKFLLRPVPTAGFSAYTRKRFAP